MHGTGWRRTWYDSDVHSQIIIPHKPFIKYICHAFTWRILTGKVFVFPMPIYQKKWLRCNHFFRQKRDICPSLSQLSTIITYSKICLSTGRTRFGRNGRQTKSSPEKGIFRASSGLLLTFSYHIGTQKCCKIVVIWVCNVIYRWFSRRISADWSSAVAKKFKNPSNLPWTAVQNDSGSYPNVHKSP